MTNNLANIVVVGQGAMGLLWYHHLSQENRSLNGSIDINKKISLLASDQNLLSNNKNNTSHYQFTSDQNKQPKSYALIYSNLADIKSADIILLCLKSFNITSAIKHIAKDISPHCLVILAHNGLGTFEEVTTLLPKKQTILALLTTHGCLRTAPLAITHTGIGECDIGILSGELTLAQQNKLATLLNDALPQATFYQDIIKKQWIKLAINCVINPITALNNIDNGEVNDQQFNQQINLLLTEIIKVSQAENIDLDFSDLQVMVKKVAQATTTNCSSMRSDVLAGRVTEIDYINGYIHRLGQKNNVATPENTRLWQQVINLKAKS